MKHVLINYSCWSGINISIVCNVHECLLKAPFKCTFCTIYREKLSFFFILFWSSFIRRLNVAYRSPTRFTTILWYFHLSLYKQSLLSNPTEYECNLIFFLSDISLCQFSGGGEKQKTAKNNCATFILYGSIFSLALSLSLLLRYTKVALQILSKFNIAFG